MTTQKFSVLFLPLLTEQFPSENRGSVLAILPQFPKIRNIRISVRGKGWDAYGSVILPCNLQKDYV